jgi:hypothetical protein
MVALGGTLAYISPGTLAYGENVFIPIQVCSRTHVYQKTLPEFLSVFPVRYNRKSIGYHGTEEAHKIPSKRQWQQLAHDSIAFTPEKV